MRFMKLTVGHMDREVICLKVIEKRKEIVSNYSKEAVLVFLTLL